MTAEVRSKLKVLKKDPVMLHMIKETFYGKNIEPKHKIETSFTLSVATEINIKELFLSDKIAKDIIDTEAEEAE